MRPEQYYRPPTSEDLSRFVNNKVVPPVDPVKLDMSLLAGEDRTRLHTATTGDMSLVLFYRNREGYLASVGDEGEVLSVLQFQGATRGEGYRVASGVHIVRLFASQIHELSAHPDGPYRELYMPQVTSVKGVEDAVSEMAVSRYESLAAELGLKYSHEERRFVKRIK